jgi:hypothetical protein
MKSSRIALVALNLHTIDKHYANFSLLDNDEKIHRLEQRIKLLCEQLKKNEPDSMWIIAWKEHGIFKAVDAQVKQLFKNRLKNLTQQYPNLTIIAGTLLTQKSSDSLEKLNVIEAYYKKNAWVKNEEKNHWQQSEFESEENQIAVAKNLAPNIEYAIFRNTCYIFHGDKTCVRDKITPFEETQTSYSQQLIKVYQPGNKKSAASLFEVIHPTTNTTICFGVEICRENLFSVLKKTNTEQPLIHFLLSDTLPLNVHHAHGDYVLQLDSDYTPKLLYLGKENAKQAGVASIVLYQNNLANRADNILQGPFESIYPFEKKVVDLLDDFLWHHVSNQYSAILELKNKFIKESGRCDETNTYHILSGLLLDWKNNKELSGKEKKLYDDLLELIAYETKENHFNKDYLVRAEKEIPMSCSGSKTINPFKHADEPPPKKRRKNPSLQKIKQMTAAHLFYHKDLSRLTNHLYLRPRRHAR